MNQKLSLDARNLLQPKIYIGTQQIYRSGQNEILRVSQIEKNSNKKEKRDLIRSSLPPRKLRLCLGSHKERAITKSLLPHPIPTKEEWCSLRILHK
jgi:hypothetical protein